MGLSIIILIKIAVTPTRSRIIIDEAEREQRFFFVVPKINSLFSLKKTHKIFPARDSERAILRVQKVFVSYCALEGGRRNKASS